MILPIKTSGTPFVAPITSENCNYNDFVTHRILTPIHRIQPRTFSLRCLVLGAGIVSLVLIYLIVGISLGMTYAQFVDVWVLPTPFEVRVDNKDTPSVIAQILLGWADPTVGTTKITVLPVRTTTYKHFVAIATGVVGALLVMWGLQRKMVWVDLQRLELVPEVHDDDIKVNNPVHCVKAIALVIKAELGLLHNIPANRELVKRRASEIMHDYGMRPSQIAYALPRVVLLVFVPLREDLETEFIMRSSSYRKLLALVGHNKA